MWIVWIFFSDTAIQKWYNQVAGAESAWQRLFSGKVLKFTMVYACMEQIKGIALYNLALIVLLAPAIILGWIGLSLLGWLGLILGVIVGLVIFAFSVNKIAGQEEADSDLEPAKPPAEEQRQV